MSRQLRAVTAFPARVVSYARRQILFAAFRSALENTEPLPLERETGAQLHALTGRRGLADVIGAFESFYRFAPTRHPLLVHDDGSLTDADVALVHRHLPGARVVRRAEADRRVAPLLEAAGLRRCIDLRARLPFALKLIDLRVYAEGRPALYFDGDVLFHRSPELVHRMLANQNAPWVDRYNEDVVSSYAWTPEQVANSIGVRLRPQVNAGLVCVRRPDYAEDFELFENCLALETPPDLFYYTEQTLNAIELTRRGAEPLPPDYDVCFRHAARGDYDDWLKRAEGGEQVTSQHYCGGWAQRRFYYHHFIDHVAPALQRRGLRPQVALTSLARDIVGS